MNFLDLEITKLAAGELKSHRGELLAGKFMGMSWPAVSLNLAAGEIETFGI